MILGIDPGLLKVGWAIVDGSTYRCSGTLNIPKHDQQAYRLMNIWRALEFTPIKDHEIKGAVIEDSFVGRNSRSSIKFAEAVGVIKLWLAHRSYEVIEISPASIKKGIAGHGQADKVSMKRAVAGILQRPVDHLSYHEIDALAAALVIPF